MYVNSVSGKADGRIDPFYCRVQKVIQWGSGPSFRIRCWVAEHLEEQRRQDFVRQGQRLFALAANLVGLLQNRHNPLLNGERGEGTVRSSSIPLLRPLGTY